MNQTKQQTPEAPKKSIEPPSIDEIIRYESGELNSYEEVVTFFQKLIDSGLAWKLQGHYGRTAKQLIEEGICTQ